MIRYKRLAAAKLPVVSSHVVMRVQSHRLAACGLKERTLVFIAAARGHHSVSRGFG